MWPFKRKIVTTNPAPRLTVTLDPNRPTGTLASQPAPVAQPAAAPEVKETPMANTGFTSWLTKAGQWIKNAASTVVTKIIPVANTVVTEAANIAQKLEPVEDLVLGPYSTEFNIVVDAVISTEQSWALVNQQAGTGEQKAAEVLADVESKLLPQLVASGLTTEDATAYLKKFIDAIVTILNGPTKAA